LKGPLPLQPRRVRTGGSPLALAGRDAAAAAEGGRGGGRPGAKETASRLVVPSRRTAVESPPPMLAAAGAADAGAGRPMHDELVHVQIDGRRRAVQLAPRFLKLLVKL